MIEENAAHTGYCPYLIIVKTPSDENEPEIIKYIPVRDCDAYRVKINKKSLSAAGGARGLFCFISDCIKNDFMLSWVWKICDNMI